MTSAPIGKLVVISSPSGGGKDAIIRRLLKIFPNSARLVTTTTRSARAEDKEGTTYHFTDKTTFENKIKTGEILEHNQYSGNYYGIEKKRLEEALQKHSIVFTNVDIHGRRTLATKGWKNLSIFVMPESLEQLKRRILHRGNVLPADLENRLLYANTEMASAKEYDYTVVNHQDHLNDTVKNIAEIIKKWLKSNLSA